jgi:hypothetical protein
MVVSTVTEDLMMIATTGRGLRMLAVPLFAATLVACGGGGGDGPGPSGGAVPLTTTNRDSVAHAVAGAALGLGGVDQALQSSAVAARQLAMQVIRARPMAVHVSPPIACAYGGTMTETDDDRDNDGMPSVGDVVTLVYDQCRESADDLTHGTTSIQITAASASSVSMLVTATQLLDDRGLATDLSATHHKTTMDGTMTVDTTMQSASAATVRIRSEGLTMVLQTPVFTDTVTLHPGFEQVITADDAAAPPGGAGTPGRASVTMSGTLGSALAAGTVVVATDTPFIAYSDDPFPRSGVLRALGSTGTLRMTGLSTEQVQVDLDANDDGTYEDLHTVRWDWLI